MKTPPSSVAFALILGLVIAVHPAPALAQWTRVNAIPLTDVYGLFANADTIVAGVDTATYVSTNAGQTWKRSVKPAAGVAAIDGVLFRSHRLFAGTFGKGVFVSDDLGDHWQDFNQGLVGGIANSQLFVTQLLSRGDSLYASTSGAGVWVRSFAAGQTWHHFGDAFEPNQASNVNDIALGGVRIVASCNSNGNVFYRDPGDADWTQSFLDNMGINPALTAYTAVFSGSRWVVGGSNTGVFHSAAGHEPWTFVNLGLGSIANAAFAARAGRLFGAFEHLTFANIMTSGDGGASWQLLETLPGAFVYRLATVGPTLYAGRADGLWIRAVDTVDVPRGDSASAGLAFALAGPQPVSDEVRVRFMLPEAGRAAIDVFDVRGRRVGERIEGAFAAGPQQLAWDAGALAPGVYVARLSAAGRHATVRLVHVRR